MILNAVIDDVDGQIIKELREQAGEDRQALLSQLDVMARARRELNARFSYRNPADRTDQ